MAALCARAWPATIAGWDARRTFGCSVLTGSRGTVLLTTYRVIIACYLISVALYDWGANAPNKLVYMAFLTNVGMWCTILYFWFASVTGAMLLHDTGAQAPGRESITIALSSTFVSLTRGTQTLFQLSTTFETIIAGLYWTLLYKEAPPTSIKTWINSSVHGVAAAAIWLDLLLGSNRPIDGHVSIAVIVGVLYMFTNLAVTLNVQVLYPILTWRDAGSIVLSACTLVGILGVYFGMSLVAAGRDAAVARCGGGSAQHQHQHQHAVSWGNTAAYELTASDGGAGTTPTPPSPSLQMARAFRAAGEAPSAFFADASVAFPLATLPCVQRRVGKGARTVTSSNPLLDAEGGMLSDSVGDGADGVFATRGAGSTTRAAQGYVSASRLDDAIHPL